MFYPGLGFGSVDSSCADALWLLLRVQVKSLLKLDQHHLPEQHPRGSQVGVRRGGKVKWSSVGSTGSSPRHSTASGEN